jgi:hypothetical protein
MSEGVVDVPEGQRNKYMVEISLLIIIIPLLIALFMKRMVVPNL